jgi:hypothetical protein
LAGAAATRTKKGRGKSPRRFAPPPPAESRIRTRTPYPSDPSVRAYVRVRHDTSVLLPWYGAYCTAATLGPLTTVHTTQSSTLLLLLYSCTLALPLLYKKLHAMYPYNLHSRNYNFSRGPRRKKWETKKATEGDREKTRPSHPIPSHPSPTLLVLPAFPPVHSPLPHSVTKLPATPPPLLLRRRLTAAAARVRVRSAAAAVFPRAGYSRRAPPLPLHSPVPLQPPITLSPTHSFLPSAPLQPARTGRVAR